MASIKVSFEIEETVWRGFRALACASGRSVPELLTDAIRERVARHGVRPEVRQHLAKSMARNERLGRLLAE
jgi:hypothetical protein